MKSIRSESIFNIPRKMKFNKRIYSALQLDKIFKPDKIGMKQRVGHKR